MFGQMLPGSEPRPSEDLDWHYNSRFKQTSIFGDVCPWNLIRSWAEQCVGSQNWSIQNIPSQNWVDQNVQNENWAVVNDPEINKTRC